ncbi:hypothetical protein RB623_07960 [Mesorhizobium sp. LHD-90]|uniref:DUF6790 family protein n=1 Tax=Mesorhizobium sp. LHD-90 TaxID=3071414 RepID=UPI0027E0DE74|nr:DUF6790 family protein [Mesorhizobium sp. LHD-90]MDQ6433979.1 hypothetical protein [Mesorhizobium sp. LHD-90]
MYLVSVLALMLVLPAGSIVADYLSLPAGAAIMPLVGKWFVFWSAGVRLMLAGIRQYFQPEFTAHEIFEMKSAEALPVVRELGVANFSIGTVGVLSLLAPSFVLPVAIAAGIFYGVAGVRHAMQPARSRNETVAMVTDLFAFFVLAAFVAWTYFG